MKKLYISLLGTALLSVVLLSWLIDGIANDNDEHNDFSQQQALLSGMLSYLGSYPAEQQRQRLAELNSHFNLDLGYAANSTLALPSPLRQQLEHYQGITLADEDGLYLVRSAEQLNNHHLTMRLPKPASTQHDLLLTVLFYSGFSLCMWLPLIPLTRRITTLANAATRFAKGKLDTRIAKSRFSYTQQLEHSFNSMAEQINALLAENKLMASSLSHDIRTPIACLRFGLDAAMDSEDEHSKQAYLKRMEKDLDTMESMLKSYLSFAALQQQNIALNYTRTELLPYLQEVGEQLLPQLGDKQLHIDCPSELVVHGDLHWLARCIHNIITNALRYANGQVVISAYTHAQQLCIAIADDGPGIPPQERAAVLKPFYQSAKHRNQDGYGLGLAICHKVMLWHQGNLQVGSSTKLGGAQFTLRLPL
ncbi:ATP-binding protein [Pseudoalteromonas sp. BDTF-M6]|uniref:ATP-binding protein n=1 Tax=Pseudoalteromonas sp. BDTF-M6 TaxID=2796132 RepID=UPI001BAF50F7|nr:ATP-binding protein [Pseudoalteromonas sp. BDTF-M6]MBS3796307.1 two-component sensor histidine kinase [Pseudoalteromonas sp. BDTF-M6]